MPRIQKKRKSGFKKKKKPTEDGSTSIQSRNDTIVKKTVSSKSKKKSPVFSQKKTTTKNVPASAMQKKNYLNIASQFLREVVMELKKVTWPTRKQTTGSTLVMIILVIMVSLFLGMVDIGLSSLIRVVLK
jgi:preprotein translocase subunit SecE